MADGRKPRKPAAKTGSKAKTKASTKATPKRRPSPKPSRKVRARAASTEDNGGHLGILMPREHRAHSTAYSRFVGLMKVLLPLVAVTLVILVVMWPQLNSDDSRFRVGFTSSVIGEAEDPSMVNARYFGTDSKSQAFSVTADFARAVAGDGIRVELENAKADIALDDGTWLVMTSKSGLYDRKANTLALTGAVNLFHDSGYEIQTAKADIDLHNGSAAGTDPVHGQGPFGSLDAQGFDLIDKGRTIRFTGKSKLTFHSSTETKP